MKRQTAVGIVVACVVAVGGLMCLRALRSGQAPGSDSGPSAGASAAVGAALPEPALPKPEAVTEGGLTGQEGTRESEAPPQGPAQTVGEPQTAPQAAPKLAWEDRISRVTEELGLTADISDCKVIVDGKTLEGMKILAALGDDLFVNEYRVHPPLSGYLMPRTTRGL